MLEWATFLVVAFFAGAVFGGYAGFADSWLEFSGIVFVIGMILLIGLTVYRLATSKTKGGDIVTSPIRPPQVT